MSKNKSKIRPLQDRLIVQRLESDEVTSGGIIIPDSAQDKSQRGVVVAVGKGKVSEDGTQHPCEVRAGDKVIFGKYAGNEYEIDGTTYLIMREDDVLGVIESN